MEIFSEIKIRKSDIDIYVKNSNFCQKTIVSSEIEILDKNRNIFQKSKFLIFCQQYNFFYFWSEIEIFIRNIFSFCIFR